MNDIKIMEDHYAKQTK